MEGYFVSEITWNGSSAISEEVVKFHQRQGDARDDCEIRNNTGLHGEAISYAYAPATAFDIQLKKKP